MTAIVIAKPAVRYRGGLDERAREQLCYNYVLIEIVALDSLVLDMFMLFTLCLVDMCSLYFLILFSLRVVLLIATFSQFNSIQASLKELSSYAWTRGLSGAALGG